MVKKELLENMSKLGVPMVMPEETLDVNRTLADVVKSHDPRLWENFTTLTASTTSLEKYNVDFKKVNDQLTSVDDKKAFNELAALSKVVYDNYNLTFEVFDKNLEVLRKVSEDSAKALKPMRDAQTKTVQVFKPFREALARAEVVVAGVKLSTERLKRVFEDYLGRVKLEEQKERAKHQELSMEYALSQVFSPKQKELFYKKLNNEPLTKTEREYFSRAVKKKVSALANPELHRLAQRMLE